MEVEKRRATHIVKIVPVTARNLHRDGDYGACVCVCVWEGRSICIETSTCIAHLSIYPTFLSLSLFVLGAAMLADPGAHDADSLHWTGSFFFFFFLLMKSGARDIYPIHHTVLPDNIAVQGNPKTNTHTQGHNSLLFSPSRLVARYTRPACLAAK